ncbi:MAG: hydrogenase expression/formation protein HypE [bacterium]|nr:hydrogenase expression/formation protein HypE [bacterium]
MERTVFTDATNTTSKRVMLAHGGGGELMQDLIRTHVLPRLGNPLLTPLTDGANLGRLTGEVVLTTDSFVVTPLNFPGGDIGRLAVCGTVNDLAMMGAEPVALSLGLVIEEGLPLELLDEVLASVAQAASEAGVRVVTGDTKVIDRRGPDGLFINTSGVGTIAAERGLGMERIVPGDVIVINGGLAEHGLAVMSVREGLGFDSTLVSDVAPLNGLVADIYAAGIAPKFLRDPTRGGLAALLVDVAEGAGVSIELDETALPISPTARHAAELLGLDPLTVANEGKCVAVVAAEEADALVACLQGHPLGERAAVIGRVTDVQPPIVELQTALGGRRIVQRPYGEELPRIC